MKKRLLWNFEVSAIPPLQVDNKEWEHTPGQQWEGRYFWPESAIILLKGLDDSFLDFSSYKRKHHEDQYFLVPNYDYNIKLRKKRFLYKPLLNQEDNYFAFAKKMALDDNHLTIATSNPGPTVEQLKTLLKQSATVTIVKSALTYTFNTQPKAKLELSRLIIHNNIFFSLCVESDALALVKQISLHLLEHPPQENYISFLKKQGLYDE